MGHQDAVEFTADSARWPGAFWLIGKDTDEMWVLTLIDGPGGDRLFATLPSPEGVMGAADDYEKARGLWG